MKNLVLICVLTDWRDSSSEGHINARLWGYPDLVKEFYDNVRPVIIEGEEPTEWRYWMGVLGATTEHAGNDSRPHPASKDQDATASSLPQLSQTAPFDDGSGPSASGVTQTVAELDSPDQTDDPTPAPDERLPPSASELRNIDALNTMSRDSISQPEIRDVRKGSAMFSPIEEFVSAPGERE